MSRRIYLDWNASAPVLPEVANAVAAALLEGGNPSSVHAEGRAARSRVEAAREAVAQLVGSDPARVIFTSGATEANNLALRGVGRLLVLVTAVEHPSVLEARADAVAVGVGADGTVDLALLERLLGADSGDAVVSVMAANNETGVLQPVAAVAALCRASGALFHVDAAQAAGRMPLDMAALGVDMLSLSAHKFGGPPGVGALVLGPGLELEPLLRGGGQERGRRAGTENVAGIVGLGAAARLASGRFEQWQKVADLRDRMEATVCERAGAVRLLPADAGRLPNTSCLALPGLPAETQVIALDLAGIAVGAGAACSSGKVRQSTVLTAMGVDAATASAAIRVSLGPETTSTEVERFVEAYVQLAARRSGRRAA